MLSSGGVSEDCRTQVNDEGAILILSSDGVSEGFRTQCNPYGAFVMCV
jgi:hypothetical protein